MPSCTSCGSVIPDGQRVCSMCYGDPHYGRDGYYLQYIEDQMQEQMERERREQMEIETEQQTMEDKKNEEDSQNFPF